MSSLMDRVELIEKFLRGRSAVDVVIPWLPQDKARFPWFQFAESMSGWGLDIATPMAPAIPAKYTIKAREAFPVPNYVGYASEILIFFNEEGEVENAELRRCVQTQGAVRIESAARFYPPTILALRGEALNFIDAILLKAKIHGKERQGTTSVTKWQI